MENAFSPFVRILGKGKTGSRSLSTVEAREAMGLILAGEVEDVQLGAFLMLLRVKEESPEELAGFALACRDAIKSPASTVSVDLDWSSYAGKRRQPHWFLLAALLLAQSGTRVFMHGARGHTEGRVYTEETLQELGIEVASSLDDALAGLERRSFAYLPLGGFCSRMDDIIGLRPLFGLRSPVHTLCRLINPFGAGSTMQSVFHPSYMDSHHRAADLLGEQNAVVFKGDAGEVEYRPHASVRVARLLNGHGETLTLPRMATPPRDQHPSAAALKTVWECDHAERDHPYGYNAIIGTTAIARLAMGECKDFAEGFAQSQLLWQNRRSLGTLN